MSNFFYPKIAVNNIQKNNKTYIPYILACICTIIMFYNMSFLSAAKNIGNLSDSRSLRQILIFGEGVVGIFSIIFLFYNNRFLIKRRKKEFGLFNILGMEKKHIARVMFFEMTIIMIISIIAGILAGILLSKLMILILFKIITFKVVFGFEIPIKSVIHTAILFSGIFIVNLIYNIFQVHLSNPIELLKETNAGEREPKTKWIIAAIGAVCLAAGYYISLTTKYPLAAVGGFFTAVILVIIGTYCIFISGSIVVLKMLRKNKKYYYKLNHFVSISSMLHRMKQHAAGLSNICILSTMVIVMLSTTISMYAGIEDVLRNRYPRNISVYVSKVSESQIKKINNAIEKQTSILNAAPKNIINYHYIYFITIQKGERFTIKEIDNYFPPDAAELVLVTIDDYNRIANESESLSKGEVLLYSLNGNIEGDVINISGLKLNIKRRLSSLYKEGRLTSIMANSYFLVADMDTIKEVQNLLNSGRNNVEHFSYYYGFDVNAKRDIQIKLTNALKNDLTKINPKVNVEGAEREREGFYVLFGGLFFLGIFLGLLFIMAVVLAMYYNQILEGYDDKERYNIMKKIGMSCEKIRQIIKNQVLTVFFLPLVIAVIHLMFAFNILTKFLAMLNFTNVNLFIICTIITICVFSVIYTIVYALTAKTYYQIVRE
ncbi:putative ABC transport system permease protein [Caloramator quimbayensis]|uniref:Putative ABC transport system permease protein n=1 Tax=Caloramator quimbayensis TaxID=1147123 RepID=A0A1T4Y8Q7_9CLOT|nr:FtsX-like permease family protein [Caloramator quimbayensis]SKA98083.1 putative ABC transport system permease protein [Caloramator quimbayensis]